MQITKTRVRLISGEKRIKAIVSVTLDNFLILNDIKVVQGNKRLCVEFPKNMQASIKGKVQYIIVPTSMEARRKIEDSILNSYYEMVGYAC
jgi:stage V sporulation protein G